MKILVEVVVTNMDTGHVAVNQHSMDITVNNHLPESVKVLKDEEIYNKLISGNMFKPSRVGPLLIDRSLLAIA